MSHTPAEIAEATLRAHAIRLDWKRTGEQILPLLIEAVEADRAQRAVIYVIADEEGDVIGATFDKAEADRLTDDEDNDTPLRTYVSIEVAS